MSSPKDVKVERNPNVLLKEETKEDGATSLTDESLEICDDSLETPEQKLELMSQIQRNSSQILTKVKAVQIKQMRKDALKRNKTPTKPAKRDEVASTSGTPMKNCIQLIDQLNLDDSPSPDKSKRRSRRRAGAADTSSPATPAASPAAAVTPVAASHCSHKMIIDLLTMDADEREKYITQLAIVKNILVVDKKSRHLSVRNTVSLTEEKWTKLNLVLEKKNQELKQDCHMDEINKLVCDAFPTVSRLMLLERDVLSSDDLSACLEAYALKLEKAEMGFFVEGIIRINQNRCQEAFLTNLSGRNDVCFDSLRIRLNAMNGDVVKAFVFAKQTASSTETEESLQPQARHYRGFVVEILENAQEKKFVGHLMYLKGKSKYVCFVGRDKRVPIIRLYFEDLPPYVSRCETADADNVLYLAEIVKWEDTNPIGRIIELIGQSGDFSVEQKAILMANSLEPNIYDADILNSIPTAVPTYEFKNRLDLRKECIFTIDPLTARDLDDAVSCEILPNGNYKVGVHIADVAFFIPEDSQLDKLVTRMTSTIYLVDRVFHMLPIPLCNLCSLLPGADKLAFSVIWEISPKAKVVSTEFKRTVINSCAQMAYEHAQQLIEDKNYQLEGLEIHNGFTVAQLSEKIHALQSLAILMREERERNGLLQIHQPKMQFKLDPTTGLPISYEVHVQKESHRLIEEFMLLANQSVAKFTYMMYPKLAVLRNHRPPNEKMLEQLKEFLKKFSLKFDTTDSKSINASLKSVIANSFRNKDAVATILNIMVSKPMRRADYFCSGIHDDESSFWHYALSVPYYTHFTSPIRRYPDIMVHRLLAAALNLAAAPSAPLVTVQAICNICNVQKYDCKLAGDDSAKFFFTQYIKANGEQRMDAAVHQIQGKCVDLVLIENGVHLKYYIKDTDPDVTIKISEGSIPLSALAKFKKPNSPTLLISPFVKICTVVFFSGESLKVKLVAP